MKNTSSSLRLCAFAREFSLQSLSLLAFQLFSLLAFLPGCSHIPKPDPNTYSAPSLSGITIHVSSATNAIHAAQTANASASSAAAKIAALMQENAQAWGYYTNEVSAHTSPADASADAAKITALVQDDTNAWAYYVDESNSLTETASQLIAAQSELAAAQTTITNDQVTIKAQTDTLNQTVKDKNTAIDAAKSYQVKTTYWRSHCLWTWFLIALAVAALIAWKFGPQLAVLAGKVAGAVIKTP